MFKKLRMRFIALTMASLLAVLLVILGGINLVNYRNVVRQADAVLDVLSENDGAFPAREGMQPMPFPENGAAPEDAKQNTDFRHDRGTGLSVEAPYESRYFSVRLADDGSVNDVDTVRIAAVDMDSAVEYAKQAIETGKACGFLDDYRYVVTASSEGDTLVIFLDYGRNLGTFRTFLLASVAMAAAGCLAVLLLVVVFSGRIVRPVAESYEKQTRFITDAGHEIKTPLAIIDADADVLELDLADENNEWLQDIRRQTRRLTELTNDLVYLSRMEEQQDRAAMVDFPVSDLVSETAQGFQSRAIQKEQHFSQSVQPMLTLHGDEKAIRQLVSILLDNAVKYTPEGGTIDLKLEQQGRNIVLSVFNDAASPVPRESMDKLFDRFYRTDPSRSSSTGGHGIGLSIAKAVVQAHKGKITVHSAEGEGTAFTVTL